MRPLLLAFTLMLLASELQAADGNCAWPDWLAFREAYIDDGRVLDRSGRTPITTSEGQAYSLFFALVANDRDSFDRLLMWTNQNLAAGDLGAQLPSWLWGVKANGQYGIIDSNAAADADLWIAYTLSEAGRLWNSHYYASLGYLMARRIAGEETANIAGLGRFLLPAPSGFITHKNNPSENTYRINPSYTPLHILDYLAKIYPQQPWAEIASTTANLNHMVSTSGFVPDWLLVSKTGVATDKQTSGKGSYEAIRSYLWAGMLADTHPHKPNLIAAMAPMLAKTIANGAAPESVDTRDGRSSGHGPVGFMAALLPLMSSSPTYQQQAPKIAAQVALARAEIPRGRGYYDTVLSLFGVGWIEHRYRFALDGTLLPAWENAQCN